MDFATETVSLLDGSVLHHAVYMEDIKSVKLLLSSSKEEVNKLNIYDKTPLHVAMEKQHRQIAEILIGSGADINAPDIYGNTPLHCALIWGGNITCVRLLLEQETINTNQQDNMGQTPLHMAVRKDITAEIAKMLIGKDANINIQDEDGRTPLHIAANAGCYKSVQLLLLIEGIDVNKQTTLGQTPLLEALVTCGIIKHDGLQVNQMLVRCLHTDINKADFNGNTPLHLLCGFVGNRRDRLSLAQEMIERGAMLTTQNIHGDTPLLIALKISNLQIAATLINSAVHINEQDIQGCTPLHIAVIKKQHNIIDRIMSINFNPLEFDPNIQDIQGKTPLHIAVDNKSFILFRCIARKLIECGVVLDTIDVEGHMPTGTPLHCAAKYGCGNIVQKMFLDPNNRLNPDIQDANGDTPLHLAVYYENNHVVGLLLENNADIDAKNFRNETPLTRLLNNRYRDRQHLSKDSSEYTIKQLLYANCNKKSVLVQIFIEQPHIGDFFREYYIVCIRNIIVMSICNRRMKPSMSPEILVEVFSHFGIPPVHLRFFNLRVPDFSKYRSAII